MRGIQIDAARFRQIRRARGLTQQQLGKLAGVSERTVRNAESGQRVRLVFLRYLAQTLGIDVLDVVHDQDELRTALREENRVANLMTAIEALHCHLDVSEFGSLADRNVRVEMQGPAAVPLTGEFRGMDGLQQLQDLNREYLIHDCPPEILDIRTGGNLVVISGRDKMRVVPTGKTVAYPWMHVYEFDNGHIVRVDNWADTAAIAEAFRPG